MDILTLNNGKMQKNNRCSTWKNRYVTVPFIKTIMKAIQEHVDSVQLDSAGAQENLGTAGKRILLQQNPEKLKILDRPQRNPGSIIME